MLFNTKSLEEPQRPS